MRNSGGEHGIRQTWDGHVVDSGVGLMEMGRDEGETCVDALANLNRTLRVVSEAPEEATNCRQGIPHPQTSIYTA